MVKYLWGQLLQISFRYLYIYARSYCMALQFWTSDSLIRYVSYKLHVLNWYVYVDYKSNVRCKELSCQHLWNIGYLQRQSLMGCVYRNENLYRQTVSRKYMKKSILIFQGRISKKFWLYNKLLCRKITKI